MPDSSAQITVFAHLPPPVHGQSLMVQLMLEGLPEVAPDLRIHHVDCRFSQDMDSVGRGGLGKVWLAVKYSLSAIAKRLRHGVKILYYIPAPAKRAAIIRDCIVLTLVRPFYPRLILHWHAVGLGEWVLQAQKGKHGLTNRMLAGWLKLCLRRHTRSLVLTEWNVTGADVFEPQETRIVYNGIPDPFPNFDQELLDLRIARQARLQNSDEPRTVTVGYIGHCTEDKGIFTLLDAIAIANANAEPETTVTFQATVAGSFMSEDEKSRFQQRIAESDLLKDGKPVIDYIGFVFDEKKTQFWKDCDLHAFPTRYVAESFGLVAAEAMAHGVTPVTSDWRMLPEIMGKCGLPTAKGDSPGEFAQALRDAVGRDDPAALRKAFLTHFAAGAHLQALGASLTAGK